MRYGPLNMFYTFGWRTVLGVLGTWALRIAGPTYTVDKRPKYNRQSKGDYRCISFLECSLQMLHSSVKRRNMKDSPLFSEPYESKKRARKKVIEHVGLPLFRNHPLHIMKGLIFIELFHFAFPEMLFPLFKTFVRGYYSDHKNCSHQGLTFL